MNVALLGSRPIVSPTDIHRVGLIAAEAHRLGLGLDHVQVSPATGPLGADVHVVLHLVQQARTVPDVVTARELGDLLRGMGADWRHLTEQACTWAGRDHVALVAAIPDMRAVVTAIGSPRPRRARQAH